MRKKMKNINLNKEEAKTESIIQQEYSEVMKKSYIDYAMSVITARALPDVRDGLKPVQRRILYDMDQLKTYSDKPYKKSARIVGDTMGKYHPHGDSSIYEALVVMAQDFKKNQILIDGHGNFGSIEGDGAAAMRYTESRLTEFSQETYLSDLDKNIIDFIPNFDGTEKEPIVLPAKVPNLLINGTDGIAVGMTTNIPPHNLGEVIDACIAYLSTENISNEDLLKYCKGPDFPTGGIIANKKDLPEIYKTGSGKIRLRGRIIFEKAIEKEKYDKLVVTEIPYTMIGSGISIFISDVIKLIETKTITDIVDISNESSKDGIRIVLHIKKNADIKNLKNLLYKKTKLEDTFSVNMLAIVNKKPEVLSLKGIISEHIKFRYELETRKYNTLLKKELLNKEIKEGLIKAYDMIDVIIEVLRGSKTLKIAKTCLMTGCIDNIVFKTKTNRNKAMKMNFTENQANAILEMKLSKLIGLEITLLNKEYNNCLKIISQYQKILSNKYEMKKIIKKEYIYIKEKYAKTRHTTLEDQSEAIFVEQNIQPIEIVLSIDKFGYIKMFDKNVYERNKDNIDYASKYILTGLNNDKICVFSDSGNMHLIKLKDLPLFKIKDKGIMIDTISNFNSKNESIIYIDLLSNVIQQELLFITKKGYVKRVPGIEFNAIKKSINCTKLNNNDSIFKIIPINNNINVKFDQIIIKTQQSHKRTLSLNKISQMKKNSIGIKGVVLKDNDYITKIEIIKKQVK